MNQYVPMTEPKSPQAILHNWNELRQHQPRIRLRNAATALNVSEAELLVTGCCKSVIRLKTQWESLLHDMELLGTVMALTRNDNAVHEKTGVYRHIKIHNNTAVVLNDRIDLRFMLKYWHYAFAVEEATPADPRYSLQFFDAYGTAVHKVYLTKTSNRTCYHELINKYRSDNQSQTLAVALPSMIENDREIEVNTQQLRNHWRNLEQTHDFENMLNKFQLTRFEAIALAGPEFVTRSDPNLFRGFMQTLTEIKLPIKLLVKNIGAVQIHSGAIHNLKITASWFNILDDNFSLHLNEAAIASMYVVERPATVGNQTSLELYDAQGNNIALVFAEYRPGLGEDPTWQDVVMSLPESVEVV